MKKRKRRLGLTVTLGIVTVMVLFGLAADLMSYSQFTDTITAQYQDYALAVAHEAVEQIDTDELALFLETEGGTEAYAALHSSLQRLCDNMKAEFIYVIDVDRSDYNHITYLFEVVNENSKFDEYPVGLVKETTNEEYRQRYKELYDGTTDEVIVVRDKGFIESGSHITALVPVKDGDTTVAILCIQRQMDYLGSARMNYMKAIISISIFLILISILGSDLYMKRRIIKPVEAISSEAERFAAENTLAEAPVSGKVTSNDELGTLAGIIDEMEHKTLDYFATLTKITAEKQRVDAELSLATEIQANMLPAAYPAFPERKDFSVYATMNPAKEVGGDFFDTFLLDETHVAVVMADVSGKGVPAALFMAIAKTLIKNHATLGQSPSDTFTNVNRLLCEGNKAGLFVTAWIGVLDLVSGKLTYCNAGHNMPLLKHGDGGFEYLKCRAGFVLAGMEGIRYRQAELEMQPGDRLFLYTDGVTEATSLENRLYGDDRLRDYLNAHIADEPTVLLPGLHGDIDEFVGEAPQFDDITMLILDYIQKP